MLDHNVLHDFRDGGIRATIMATALLACALLPLRAGATLVLNPDGLTVYDTVNKINWLADGNLVATNRFGLPVCTGPGTQPCVNTSGSMSYQAAAAWVQAMNAANYLGHSNWQLPTTPTDDKVCTKTGPTGGNFGFYCSLSALGSLYYNALGLKAPNTAVPIPGNTAGPFNNFQPYLYWSQSSASAKGYFTLSFNSGFKGANTAPNFLYVLPMIPGKLSGTPVATGKGLEVNPGGLTVYDPVTNVTWLADANLAATNTFGLPYCTSVTTPAICLNQDGAMTWDSASQFITSMNAYNGAGYLGQSNWELPPMDACGGYNCASAGNPMAELYSDQLGLSPGTPVVATPHIAVGPFKNIQPYLYWSCQAVTIQDGCQTDGPAAGFEWSFSFGNGFLGTDLLANDLYVTAYFVGPPSTTSGGPAINSGGVVPLDSAATTIQPGSWVSVYGSSLAAAATTWNADFPTSLGGTTVTVNGKLAYLLYVSPGLIDMQAPDDTMRGQVNVVVTTAAGSATSTVTLGDVGPSFNVLDNKHVAGIILRFDGSGTQGGGTYDIIGPTGSSLGYKTVAAKAGDVLELFGVGFGPTNPAVAAGKVFVGAAKTINPVQFTIKGKAVTLGFAGLAEAGQYQFNLTVPPGLGTGEVPLLASVNGVQTPSNVVLSLQ